MQPSEFDLEEIKKELNQPHDLQNPFAFHALQIIGRLCTAGKELEKQRDLIKQQRDWLATWITKNVVGSEKYWIDRASKESVGIDAIQSHHIE
jgi:hypothetical protein